uniref:Sorting nexin 1b n=1 Tax=Oryzias latipes TaxID=8090 RepID=A0A3P9LKV9_ORYLA
MATSSDRNPPPFPATDVSKPGLSDLLDGDSDEGDDIFVSNVSFRPSFSVNDVFVLQCDSCFFCFRGTIRPRHKHLQQRRAATYLLFLWSSARLLIPAEPRRYAAHLLGAGKSPQLSPAPLPQNYIRCNVSIFWKELKRPSFIFLQLEEEEAKDSFDVDVAVTNPEKVGQFNYPTSSLPLFKSKAFSVRRRFSDFLGLYEKLSAKQTLHGCIVPPPPEKSVVGMTKVKVGMDDPSSVEFVERRRAALERYLQRVVSHPSLLQDPDVREFLERDDLPRAVNTQTLSGAGFLKMINRASDAVNKMTIKMNESDTWFEDKLQEVEAEEQQLRKLHSVVDSLVNHRKELCGNTAIFAKSMAMLGNSEDNTALSRALSQLAEVEDKMEQLHQEQAASDFFILAELLADYIRLLGAVRGCLDQRMRAWQRWQEAQSTLQKKREAEAKLLWANKPDKLQQAKDEITEWETKVTQYERDFDRIGMTVRKEFLRFEVRSKICLHFIFLHPVLVKHLLYKEKKKHLKVPL